MKKNLLIVVIGFAFAFCSTFLIAKQDDDNELQQDVDLNTQPSATVDATDHTQHQTAAEVQSAPSGNEHEHMPEQMEAGDEAMDHGQMSQADPGELRDPHAYSGGYELDSGPYSLESESQIALADQSIFAGLWMDRLEYVVHDGDDVTELEGHAWIGNSYNRLLLRTEAEVVDDSVHDAEIDFLVSRAVTPFWDLQFGFRHQIADDVHRHWAAIGLNGLAPYWIEVDASIFVSEHGQTFYDLEAEYEIRLTQRLVLQPRVDIHSFGKADKELGRGAGLSEVKVGARLRYEFSRQIAPYFGIEQVSSYGETADLLPEGVDRTDTHWVFGLKFWF